MSAEYPAAGPGGWSQAPSNSGPVPGQSQGAGPQMRAFSVPANCYATPYQCGICYSYLTANVDDLESHIINHKRDLAERVHTQANSQISQQSIDQNYQAAGAHMGNFYPGAAMAPQSSYEYQQYVPVSAHSMAHYSRDPRSPTEYRQNEEFYYSNQQSTSCQESSSLPAMSNAENWARNPSCSISGMQDDSGNPDPAKQARFEVVSERGGRGELYRESTETASSVDSRTQQQQQQQQHQLQTTELNQNHSDITESQQQVSTMYHDMQPAKSNSLASSATQDAPELSSFQGEQDSGIVEPNADDGVEQHHQQHHHHHHLTTKTEDFCRPDLMRKIDLGELSTTPDDLEKCKMFSPETALKRSPKGSSDGRFSNDESAKSDHQCVVKEEDETKDVPKDNQADEKRRTSTRRSARAKKADKHMSAGHALN